MSIETEFNLLIDPSTGDLNQNIAKTSQASDFAYVSSVREDIKAIKGNKVGAAVLHTLKLWDRVVRITPVRGLGTTLCSPPGAIEGEVKDRIWNKDVHPFLNNYLGFNTRPVWSVVLYTPGAYSPGGVCINYPNKTYNSTYVGTREEILVHELVHAIRYMSRTFNPDAMKIHDSNLRNFDSVEEFAAVLVQNLYQSAAKGKIRASHHGFHELDPSLADSFEFFKISRLSFAAVEHFVGSNKFFAKRLAEIDVPFNPIRAFLKDPNKCRTLSQSSDAGLRDVGPKALPVLLSILTPGVSIELWQQIVKK